MNSHQRRVARRRAKREGLLVSDIVTVEVGPLLTDYEPRYPGLLFFDPADVPINFTVRLLTSARDAAEFFSPMSEQDEIVKLIPGPTTAYGPIGSDGDVRNCCVTLLSEPHDLDCPYGKGEDDI